MRLTKGAPRRVAILAIAGAWLATGRLDGAAPPDAADPLVALNERFRDAYRRARIERLARSGTVVLVGSQGLTLIRQGRREEVPFPPAIFHKLKEVAHVPLMTFVLLEGTEGRPLDPVRRAEVEYVRGLVGVALDGLDRSGFPPAALGRQREILGMSRAYLDAVLRDGRAATDGLIDFAKRASPLMLANADEAAAAYLAALDGQMQSWRRELSAEEWRTMHVVVMSVHMARDREIAMQYFGKLLGEPAEGRRLIFAEGLSEEPKALDLLGTHLLDGAAAAAFFGDEMRLHRDLLSDGAARALESMTIRP